MFYTLILRDENGREVALTELKATEMTTRTILVCPKDERLADIYVEVLHENFKRHGIDALICSFPLDVYQVKVRE